MKVTKIQAGGGVSYARKEPYEYEGTQYEADIQNDDIITIKNEGEKELSEKFGEQFYLVVSTRNGDKKLKVNATSFNTMIDAFGDETSEWIDKEVKAFTKKDMINNKKVTIVYLAPRGYHLDEWGDLVKKEADTPREAPAPTEKTEGQKQVEDAQEITPEDIPF